MAAAAGGARARAGVGGGDGLRLRRVGFLLSEAAAAASRGELYSWECDGVEATLVAADRRPGWMRRCGVGLRGVGSVGLTACFDLVWACMGQNIRFRSEHLSFQKKRSEHLAHHFLVSGFFL
jgi:hypothetical protein